MQDVNVQGVDVQDVNVQGVDVQDVNVQGVDVQDVDVQGVDVQGVPFFNVCSADVHVCILVFLRTVFFKCWNSGLSSFSQRARHTPFLYAR